MNNAPFAPPIVSRSTTGMLSEPVDPCRILLIELINLFGLFMKHARNVKGARANTVLFDQMVRLMDVLDNRHGHDGGMIMRRIGPAAAMRQEKPDYFIIFGDQAFRGSEAFTHGNHLRHGAHHLAVAMDQAFACFHAHGIHALYIQLPGNQPEKIDQFRLALNIAARFRQAVENNASITFRHLGRNLSVPLVRDSDGKPNPNLTLVAGLNGISAVNMRELVKQAVAFCRLSPQTDEQDCSSDNYNKIFNVRSLRSQLIQPLLEINNLPWMHNVHLPVDPSLPGPTADIDLQVDVYTPITGKAEAETGIGDELTPLGHHDDPTGKHIELAVDIDRYLAPPDKTLLDSITGIFDFDFAILTAEALGAHIGLVTRLLNSIVAQASDTELVDRLLIFVQARLQAFPCQVLRQIHVRRQGLKLEIGGRKMIIGLVHPRLIDLIKLVKERAALQEKIDTFKKHPGPLFDSGFSDMGERFELSGPQGEKTLALLRACFDDLGRFNRSYFAQRIEALRAHASTVFEVLWCVLRHAVPTEERLAILHSLPMLVEKMNDVKPALRFLLSDLLQHPDQIAASDRNAFFLATLMLRTHNRERMSDHHLTSEDVLAVRKNLNHEVVDYVAGRLDKDRDRLQTKFSAIRTALHGTGVDTKASDGAERLTFSALLAMERECLIFLSLVGGKTSHAVLHAALEYYGDPHADVYHDDRFGGYLAALMDQLRIVLRGVARSGQAKDLDLLKKLEQSASSMMSIDADPAYTQKAQQTLQWVAPAIRAIQVRWQ
ncbi:MAG: hypothetical protein HKP58_09100 [Desulfatitalea sp.]|nr:hypothetical protein [Desulfatitalea sp.]NNK00557.1 hypothetical protein [Desulfatitalea sp.]